MRNFFFLILIFIFSSLSVLANAPALYQPTFIQNKGQWPNAVFFTATLPQGWLFLEQTSLTYNFLEPDYFAHENEAEKKIPETKNNYAGHAFKVSFVNANSKAQIIKQQKSPTYYNYFIGNDAAKWAAGVNAFQKITYQELFPHINLDVYSTADHLKYDFVIAPGGKPEVIQMEYQDVSSIIILNGKLQIKTSVNEIIEEKPYAFQIVNGKKQEVPCSFTLNQNKVGFAISGNYNTALPLIIDPEIIFVTYIGAALPISANCATSDTKGNLYTGSQAMGVQYPVTAGTYQTTRAGNNIAITKYNTSGGTLYATFLGGSRSEYPLDLEVNKAEELVILGTTSSDNFPTSVAAYDPSHNSNLDYILSKLNISGTTLVASTYIGGNGNEGANLSLSPAGLTVDAQDNIYACGTSESINFPIKNGFQKNKAGDYDGVVVKFNSALSDLIWSSYLGGNALDIISDIKVGASGNVYVGGLTLSTDLPTNATAINRNALGLKDGFVATISADGNQLLACTYLGNAGTNLVQFIDLDANENVYAVGLSYGNYPVTAGVFSNPGSRGYFVHKMNSGLSSTFFSTYIGGVNSAFEPVPTAFKVDECENIYFSGYGLTSAPLSNDAYSKTFSSLYLCQLSKDARELVYGSYFGSPGVNVHVHAANHSSISNQGLLYHIECTTSSNYPIGSGLYTPKINGGNDGAVLKFAFPGATANPIRALAQAPTSSCAPFSVQFKNNSLNSTQFTWNFGDNTPEVTTRDPEHTFRNPGKYQVRLIARNLSSCKITADTTYLEIEAGTPLRAPNIITPNQDGQNDYFKITVGNVKTSLKIYNRWGRLVYQNDDYKNNWGGEDLATGTYFYVVESPENCEKFMKGWVEIAH